MQLFEKYRPRCLSEILGQPKAVQTIERLNGAGRLSGRAYWISGKSGQGKTSLARVIAGMVASEFGTEELDAQQLTPVRLAAIEREAASYCLGELPGRAYLINEAHGLSRAAVRQLLVWLERIPSHVVVVFTTTIDGQEMLFDGCEDTSPLLSRCIRIQLEQRGVADAFAQRAMEIAQAEGLDGKPIAAYKRLVNDHRGNMRAVLQAIDAGEMLS